MSGTYNPMSAVKAMMDTAKRNQPRIVSSNVPGLVSESGEALRTTPAPTPIEGLCVLVRAIEDGDAVLPADFADVAMTRDGLHAHVRPDGGICLGFFGSSRSDAVVVYGDPLMPPEQTQRVVAAFWAKARLGPFAPSKPKIEVVSS